MDNFRDFLRTLKRIHFWLICGLIMLLGLVFWFLAVGGLREETAKREKEYEALFRDVDAIKNKPRIANQTVSEEMEKLISQRRSEIADAWQVKYDQQNSEETGILTWPKELGPVFIRKIEPLRPIEKKIKTFPMEPNDDRRLNIGLREQYREYIYKELPILAESIGARWTAEAASGRRGRGAEMGGLRGNMGETLTTQAIVDWSPENQQDLLQNHFTWTKNSAAGAFGGERGMVSGGGEPSEPDTLQILYTQEDLWVLRALMKIIKDTNGGAQSRFNAAIKKIEFIRIGKDAIDSAGKVTPVLSDEELAAQQGAPGMGMGMGMEGGGGGASDYEMMSRGAATPDGADAGGYSMGMDGGEMGMGGPQIPDPAEGRYVDKDYKSLPAETLRSVLSSEEPPTPENAYLAVAKRVPIRVRVSIDQQKLAKLLVACANSELTVEVRQIRVNPTDDGSIRAGFGRSYGSEFGRGESMGRRGRDFGGRGGIETIELNPFPYDVIAEIYGIVYIYNPVDNKALGIEETATEGEEVDPNSVTAIPQQQAQPGRTIPG